LRQWGCRQFAIRHSDLASDEIGAWYELNAVHLPPEGRPLWELTSHDLQSIGRAYGNLYMRPASRRRTRNGRESSISVGATGAAKILFALRPEAMIPWDEPIRSELGLTAAPGSYVSYLRNAQDLLEGLQRSYGPKGFELSELPRIVGSPNSTAAKIIDEYYWVTISRRCLAPPLDKLQRWISWEAE